MADGLSLDVDGIQEVFARMDQVERKVLGDAGAGLLQEAQRTAQKAAERAPVKSGRLRASVVVSGPELGPDGTVAVAVAFTAPYAAEVHERTGSAHREGEPKFLEKAGNESAAGAAERVANKSKVG